MYVLKYNYCFERCNKNKPVKFDIETTERYDNIVALAERLDFLCERYKISIGDLHVSEYKELTSKDVSSILLHRAICKCLSN